MVQIMPNICPRIYVHSIDKRKRSMYNIRIMNKIRKNTPLHAIYRPWVLLCIACFVCIIPGCRVAVGEDCVDIIGIEGQIFNTCLDLVPPAPITNQEIVAADTTITITWTPSISNDVAETHITWSSDHDQKEQSKTMNGTSVTATITALQPYTEYTVRIKTIDTSGNVSPTTEITATTAASLLFTDNTPSFSSAETPGSTVGQVSATVNAPNTAITIASYEIMAYIDDDSALFAIDSQTGEITVGESTLDPHVSYSFTVRATSTQGISTTTIVTVAPHDTTAPAPITALHADTVAGTSNILLTWTDSPSTDVRHVRITWHHQDGGGDIGGPIFVAPDTEMATISSLESDTEYIFTLVAEDNSVDAFGDPAPNVSPAEQITVRTADITIPDPISALHADAGAGTSDVLLSWIDSPSTDVLHVRITWQYQDGSGGAGGPILVPQGTQSATISALDSEQEYTFTLVAEDGTHTSAAQSVTATTGDTTAPDSVTLLRGTANRDGTSIELSWNGSYSTDVASVTVAWALSGAPDIIGSTPASTSSGSVVHTITDLMPYTLYNISVIVTDIVGNARTRSISIRTAANRIDRDGDSLIDINTLSALHNMRYNLAGTSYKESSSDSGILCGRSADTTCIGYELRKSMTFDRDGDVRTYNTASYALDRDDHHASYFPITGSGVGGWQPIGSGLTPFNAIFEGNGFYIRGLAVRRNTIYVGMFGYTSRSAVIRNIRITNNLADYAGSSGVNIYIGGLVAYNNGTIINSSAGGPAVGGSISHDHVGGLVGYNRGTINSSNASGTVGGGGSSHNIGGLVGTNYGAVAASYATGTVNGGSGDQGNAGGLIGVNGGTVVASYATGNVNGGNGDRERVGGLVGSNTSDAIVVANYATGTVDGGDGSDIVGGLVGENRSSVIIASYATGTVNGGNDPDVVGGLVGYNGGTITASYAIGNISGGNSADAVGALVGHNGSGTIDLPYGSITGHGTVVSSYGFGTLQHKEINGTDGSSDRPTGAGDTGSGIAGARPMVPFGTSSYRAVPAVWNRARDNTRHAWNMGSISQAPILRYADYDGAGTEYGCGTTTGSIATIPSTVPTPSGLIFIVCGTTPLPGQRR